MIIIISEILTLLTQLFLLPSTICLLCGGGGIISHNIIIFQLRSFLQWYWLSPHLLMGWHLSSYATRFGIDFDVCNLNLLCFLFMLHDSLINLFISTSIMSHRPVSNSGVQSLMLTARLHLSTASSSSSLTFSPLYRPVPPALGSPFLRLKPPS